MIAYFIHVVPVVEHNYCLIRSVTPRLLLPDEMPWFDFDIYNITFRLK